MMDYMLHGIEKKKKKVQICIVERELAGAQVAGYFSHINSMLWILKFTALNMSIEFLYLICLCDIIYVYGFWSTPGGRTLLSILSFCIGEFKIPAGKDKH